MRGVVPVVGHIIEALRAQFVDDTPLGGAVTAIEHRPGADVALDGLFEGNCSGLVWVNVIRLFRTTEFPHVSEDASPCRGQRAAVIQVGAARCVSTMDDDGYAPTAGDMDHDALVGLDDADRLERALCQAAKGLEDRGLIHSCVWSPCDPIGPQGGALAWVMTLTIELA